MTPSSTPSSKTTLAQHWTVFDGWRSITISLYLTLVGYAVLADVPVISNRFGLAGPLLLVLLSMAVIVGMLSFGINDVNTLIHIVCPALAHAS